MFLKVTKKKNCMPLLGEKKSSTLCHIRPLYILFALGWKLSDTAAANVEHQKWMFIDKNIDSIISKIDNGLT